MTEAGSILYRNARDHKDKKTVKDMYSTERLEAAREEYKLACEAAERAVTDQLRKLAGTLEVSCL